ncbi:PA14 domain-containing protein [Pendulispora brunnea]|uniref:PA14 domain-containing protein n=1 Tax=Pendulispora brunnea TaxID=2905690 RepID=A0ABZ2KRA5_9BACT
MRYELNIGRRCVVAFAGVLALAATTGCQASFKATAGGSNQPSTYNPPPSYNEPPQGQGRGPRRAPMPGAGGPTSTNNPPPYNPPPYNPGPQAPRYTLPGGESVPVATANNGFGDGQATADALRGFVYSIPAGTSRLPSLQNMRPIGVIYARSLDVPERNFRDGFPGIDNTRNEWFAIRYEGTFNVSRTANYSFRLRSDDGSLLYIDDTIRLNNDGLHSAGGGAVNVPLNAGTHRIRVDYFQGGAGNAALQLFVAPSGSGERIFTTSL